MKKRISNLLNRIRHKDIRATLELGAIKDPAAISPMIEALGDENEWVRNYISLSLHSMNNPAVTELLVHELKSNKIPRKLHALDILGMIGDPMCIDCIKSLTIDSQPEVSRKAERVLRKMQNKLKA
jgi:HEAT repeat protein